MSQKYAQKSKLVPVFKHHAMKTCEGVEVDLHTFLNLTCLI